MQGTGVQLLDRGESDYWVGDLLALPLGLLPCGGVACPSPSSTSASSSIRGLFLLNPASIIALVSAFL